MEQDTKEKLLHSAIHLFGKYGFDKISIRQIAERAGTNSALISYYFGSKQKLYELVIEKQVSALEQFLTPQIQELDPREVLRLYAVTLQKIHQENPMLIRFLCRELIAPSNVLDTFIKKRLQFVFLVLKSALKRGIQQGIFRPDINIQAAVILWAGMVNFYYMSRPIHTRIKGTNENDTLYMQQAITVFLTGIERSPHS
jgi:TetR/AcrR family transcriptional regulator